MTTKTFLDFSGNKEVPETIEEWWKGLENRKGDRAILRRCGNTTEVMFVPEYHKLRLSLMKYGLVNDRALACLTGVLAHVRNDTSEKSVAKLMAQPKDAGGTRKVSELRFKRLIQCETPDDLFNPMIRIVRLLENTVNIAGLGKDLYEWGDRTKKRWAFDYYSAI
ncbi:MAG: type I-E CRISPR-associated protein Cse2/CasB [Desulfomonilaceae bacterium]